LATRPDELKARLKGLLAFPLTPFDASYLIEPAVLREEIEFLIASSCSAIFIAGGTGEFFSLSLSEYKQVVDICVDQVRGRMPVVAGAGYGTSLALEFVRAAEDAGADGVLVLPPYLAEGPQAGLAEHYLAIARSTQLGVIVYQRDVTRFEPSTIEALTRAENVIGFKDGVGDIDRLQRIRAAVGDRLAFMNGMPTAELFARSMATCGVRTYSSALLCFMPEISVAFAKAFAANEIAAMDRLTAEAILPFAEIRRRVPGYAVSLVKAGARLRGLPVGAVRPPLVDPSPADEEDLARLLKHLDLTGPLH